MPQDHGDAYHVAAAAWQLVTGSLDLEALGRMVDVCCLWAYIIDYHHI